VQNQFPPIPCDPFPDLPLYTDGTGNYYYDDRGFDYSAYRAGRMTADETPPVPSPGDGGSGSETYSGSFYFPTYTITTDLEDYTNFWLTIMNNGSGQAQVSIISTLAGYTYAILTNSDLTSSNWNIWQVLVASNSITPAPLIDLNLNTLYFEGEFLSNTFWVRSNVTAERMVSALMGTNPVIVTNITYTGSSVARGIFGNGSAVRLNTNAPAFIDTGLIFSTGWITNAYGPNLDSGDNGGHYIGDSYDYDWGPSDLGQPGDADLNNLLDVTTNTCDAAMLEFDIVATNSFELQFEYIFASEEYPEYIGPKMIQSRSL
jgi:hypothetical protein